MHQYTFKEDRINLTVYEKFESTSGKYLIFFGEHFNGADQCYDVGAFDQITGQLLRRHYISKEEADDYWQEFKTLMRGEGDHGEQEPGDDFTIYGPDGKEYIN